MTYFISGLLACLAIGVVIYPFIRARFRPGNAPAPNTLDHVGRRERQAIHEEIRALQLERELGSIDDGEYEAQLAAHRWRLAVALRDQGGRRRQVEVEHEPANWWPPGQAQRDGKAQFDYRRIYLALDRPLYPFELGSDPLRRQFRRVRRK